MSHVATVELHVTDLGALAAACDELGLKLNLEQKTYRWYGKSVGDYPLPQGFSAKDLGKCAHAISIPGDSNAYEIGVVPRRDGKPGYQLMWDFWAGGFGMAVKAGANCSNIIQGYTKHRAIQAAQAEGWTITGTKTLENGKIQLIGVKA